MRKQFIAIFILYVVILTGCNNTNLVEEHQSVLGESYEVNESEETIIPEEQTESVEDSIQEQETPSVEESINPSENAEEEVTAESSVVYKTIPVEEIVYEENDVVFVIAKRYSDSRDYGYLISAGGKVVPFQVAHEDFFTLEMGADYGNILDMEAAEPLMELESDVINQYIEMLKNIDENNKMNTYGYSYDVLYEHIEIYGRKVDCDKNVDYDEIYAFSTLVSEPTDTNAIEIMNWLLELNETLTEETKEE